jgi:hypothetical protein
MMRFKLHPEDTLQVSIELITQSREKKLNDAFNRLLQSILTKVNFKEATKNNN